MRPKENRLFHSVKQDHEARVHIDFKEYLAAMELYKQQAYKKAVEEFEKILQWAKQHPDNQFVIESEVLFKLGLCYQALGESAKSIDIFESYLSRFDLDKVRRSKDLSKLLEDLALLYMEDGQPRKALELLERLCVWKEEYDWDQQFDYLEEDYMDGMFSDEKLYQNAVSAMEKSQLADEYDLAFLYLNRAICHEELCEYEEAVACFDFANEGLEEALVLGCDDRLYAQKNLPVIVQRLQELRRKLKRSDANNEEG